MSAGLAPVAGDGPLAGDEKDAPADARPGLVDRVKASLPAVVIARYGESDAGEWAAAIALRVLLSLFPIVLAILFVISLVLRDSGTRDSALGQLARVIPGGSSGDAFSELSSVVDGVRKRTGLLGLVGLLGLLWGGSALFGSVEVAFGRLYGFQRRSFVRGKLMAVGLILLFAVLVVIGVATSAALAVLSPIAERAGPAADVLAGPGRWLVQIGVGVVVGIVLNGMILWVVPRPRARMRVVLPGAVVAGIGFELLTLVWPLYLSLAGGGNRYGQTFGLVVVIVSYVYLLAQLLMVGAVLNAVLGERRTARLGAARSTGTVEVTPPRRLAVPHA